MSLAVLRRHINPLDSPLYHLPSDLFPEIVSHLSSETDLINVTHISYHLRNTLLSYPNLWSHIDFEHELRARTFLERSGQTPLHIDMSGDGPYIACSLAELRQQSRRIATLKLPSWPVQKKFLSELLPSLRRLEVVSNSDRGYDWGDGWDTFLCAGVGSNGENDFVVFSLFNLAHCPRAQPYPGSNPTSHVLQVSDRAGSNQRR